MPPSFLLGPLSTTHVPVCACFLERSQPQKESQSAAVAYLSPLKLYPLWGASLGPHTLSQAPTDL